MRLIELDNTTGSEAASIAFKIFNDYGDATGEWISRNGDKKYLVKLSLMSTFPGAKNNIYIDAGAQSTEEVEKFAIELKKGILEKNKKSVADKIAYPIDVEVDGKIVEIKNRRAFIDQFDKIFYPDFVEVIRNQCFPLNMDSSYRGIMLGDRGEIWLNYVYHKTISDAQLKVVGINNGKEQ
ncbi:hypothetical protein KIH86_27840 [Paenibacillus sp. HN-1]|uniref:hypothetical protein n=1 Tax=Paenibacillus TaxID=44249 RepID=UPI001CA7C10D|nr:MULTISPECIES: hypothetical protein [Paenibacillus]MBY9078833.1 hypothetical protein [Paenibacillus sp. CGMCC 1.18879]MBY9088007.1 hypothetical protein [Paenibacillus sinensis]